MRLLPSLLQTEPPCGTPVQEGHAQVGGARGQQARVLALGPLEEHSDDEYAACPLQVWRQRKGRNQEVLHGFREKNGPQKPLLFDTNPVCIGNV